MARMLWPAALTALLLCGCRARPVQLTGAARESCEDKLSATLGGFPDFPQDPRNQLSPALPRDDQALAIHIRGVVGADGIQGIYDCDVISRDSGGNWVVTDLKFNRLPPEE
jgi:hypothetical protein